LLQIIAATEKHNIMSDLPTTHRRALQRKFAKSIAPGLPCTIIAML
jgi:hypothetical protein